MSERPLSEQLAKGWAVAHYSTTLGENGVVEHCFHLQKGRENKVLRIRKKMLGAGVVAEELEI